MPSSSTQLRRALKRDPANIDLAAATALRCFEEGDRAEALQIMQDTLAKNPPTALLMQVLGDLSLRMDMPDYAAKFLAAALEIEPGNPSHYVNLASCYIKQERADEALSLAKSAVEMFPAYASLWNIIGVLTRQHLNDHANAMIFFQEAIRLDPVNVAALNNLAECYGPNEQGIALYRQVLTLEPDNHAVRLSLAIAQFQSGQIADGWKSYEARLKLAAGLAKDVTFVHRYPLWNGGPLTGKTVLVMAEQGIGDEVMFAAVLPALMRDAGHVVVACAPRLVSIFRRSFTGATIIPFEDKVAYGRRERHFPDLKGPLGKSIDIAVPLASLPQYYWRDRQAMAAIAGPYLTPCPETMAKLAPRIPRQESGLVFGISWRSGKMTAERRHGYWDFDMVEKMVATPGVTFLNLQYGATAEELAALKKAGGTNFVHLPDVDLFNDLEANLALMALSDLVMGPPIAPQMLAMATGKWTWILAPEVPWWMFGALPGWGMKPSKNIIDAPFSHALKFSFFRKRQRDLWDPYTFQMLHQWITYLRTS
ncbi:MAG: tetratricopeptide repeat protein [Alphaproteobacteria bacterium]|nr:MAG: tetratricopeptide repeat protein [Alphaproteobacteria bacterium]